MFYEDLFDIEEEYTNKHKKYATGFSSIFELKREKKFYALYSAFNRMSCYNDRQKTVRV